MTERVFESTGHPGADGKGTPTAAYGNTGGPGVGGATSPRLSLVKNEATKVADLHEQVRNERIKLFTGITGGVGQAGDIQINEQGDLVAEVSSEVEERLNQSLLDKIDDMKLDDLKKVITSQNNALCASLANVQASNGNRGYTIGKALIRAKYLTEKDQFGKGFEAWHKANLDNRSLSLRTCYKYMDIAKIPGVLNWLVLGIEKLAALKPLLLQRVDIDNLDKMDPIGSFMKEYEIDPHAHTEVEDLRFEIGVGMAMARLRANNVKVSRELVYDFLAKGFDLKLKDIEVMKETQESGGSPGSYLERLIKNGQRPKANKRKQVTVDNINEQAQLLVDDIGKLLKTPGIMGEINVDRIDVLITKLGELKTRLQTPADN